MKGERVSMEIDRTIFTSVARLSYAWEREDKERTAVERVNARLEVSFGFDRHFIRGQKKMELRVGLALHVMLAMVVVASRDGRNWCARGEEFRFARRSGLGRSIRASLHVQKWRPL